MNFFFMICAFHVLARKFLHILKSEILSHILIEKLYHFICYFRSMTYFILIFIYGARYGLKSFLHVDIQLFQH